MAEDEDLLKKAIEDAYWAGYLNGGRQLLDCVINSIEMTLEDLPDVNVSSLTECLHKTRGTWTEEQVNKFRYSTENEGENSNGH